MGAALHAYSQLGKPCAERSAQFYAQLDLAHKFAHPAKKTRGIK